MRIAPAHVDASALRDDTLTTAQRVRVLYGLGLQAAVVGSPAHLDDAERYLVEAASQAGAAGLQRWRAQALASLAFNVNYLRGDLEIAASTIHAVHELVHPDSQQAAYAHIVGALVDIDLGRHRGAAQSLSRARVLGLRLRSDNILGFVAWVEAHFAAAREDHAGLMLWLEEAERRAGTWFESVYGHVFLLDAAVLSGQVDDEPRAAEYLQRAAARDDAVTPAMAQLATALHAGRFGDPHDAGALLEAVVVGGMVPRRSLWHAQTLRALAVLRGGDPDTARALLADATALAADVSDRGLPERLEPLVLRALAAVAPDLGSPDEYGLRLLGGFDIVRGGVVLPPPPGRAGELIAMLALRKGRSMPLEDAIERLWPDAAPGIGRQRLRNVLTRVRSAVGELVRRDRNDVVLAPEVTIDVEQFVTACTVAKAATGSRQVAQARDALRYYVGDLLPAFGYAEWAAMPRERLRARAAEMHAILAADAQARGDLETAIQAISHLCDLDPMNEAHPLRAARVLEAAGQPGRARAWWARTDQVCAELGLPLPDRGPADRLRASSISRG